MVFKIEDHDPRILHSTDRHGLLGWRTLDLYGERTDLVGVEKMV
jgi:hypothetical protein